MSRVDSIKAFYLDQKLLKIIITLFLKGFGKNAFLEKYWPHSVCVEFALGTSVPKSLFFMKNFQRDFIRPKKEIKLCLLHALIQLYTQGSS